jgi:hypothetical protein
MVSEELKIIIRAEAKAAIDEMGKFKKATNDTASEMKNFAKQLIGPIGVGYAIKEVTRFLKDSVAAYYQATGEVNKFAEATKNLKIGIGEAIANDPLISWLGDVAYKSTAGAKGLDILRAALKGLSLDTSLPINKQIELIQVQLKAIDLGLPNAQELLRTAQRLAQSGTGSREHVKEAQEIVDSLNRQKEFWQWELAEKNLSLDVERAKTAELERQKMLQSEYMKTVEGEISAKYVLIGLIERLYSQDLRAIAILEKLRAELLALTGGRSAESFSGQFQSNLPGIYSNMGLPLGVAWGATPVGGPTNYRPDFSTGGNRNYGVEAEVDAATADILKNGVPWLKDGAADIKEIQKTMGEMAGEGAVREVASIFRSMGEAMVGAKDGVEVVTDALAGIANLVSEVFLLGAIAAFKADNVYLGTAYLIAAGLFTFVGGAFGSVPSSSSVSRWRSSSGKGNVYGLGENIQNPTGTVVVQNISGSVWQTDQLQALSANAARGLNSGR